MSSFSIGLDDGLQQCLLDLSLVPIGDGLRLLRKT
jgi:hypothetical protein